MAVISEVTFPASTGRPMRAALAVPERPGPRPAVLVLHEVYGLTETFFRTHLG